MNNGNTFDWNQQTFPKLTTKSRLSNSYLWKKSFEGHPLGYDDWAVLPGQGLYYNPDMIFLMERKISMDTVQMS